MTCKQVYHHEALGGRRARVSRPPEAQDPQLAESRQESQQLAFLRVGSPGPLSSPEGLACSGRTERPSGQSACGMGELACAGWEVALHQRGSRGGFLGHATVRGPAPKPATPATHQTLFIQQGQVVFTHVDQRGHLLVQGQHLELPLSQVKESLYEGLQAHPCGEETSVSRCTTAARLQSLALPTRVPILETKQGSITASHPPHTQLGIYNHWQI